MKQSIGEKMSNIKYIYWFAYYNEDSPSVRYRGKYPLEYFKENYNIDSSVIIPGYSKDKIFAFIKSYGSALFFRKKESLIVIQRVHSSFIYSSLLKLLVSIRKRNTIYDLDDADYLYCKPKSIYYFAKKCAHIAAGSKAIANHLSPLNKNIIITSSPTPDLKIIKEKRSDTFTIGWIGEYGGDHKKSLIEIVFPAIKELNFNCKLILLGVKVHQDFRSIQNYFNEKTNIQLEIPKEINWNDEVSLQNKIASFDIGIATLLDNEIQRSKSGIKAKQYFNNGVPVLGTNLPENDWVIKDGVNGFYCSNTMEFKQRINDFYNMNEEQYFSFSRKARASITSFNHEKYYKSIMKITDY